MREAREKRGKSFVVEAIKMGRGLYNYLYFSVFVFFFGIFTSGYKSSFTLSLSSMFQTLGLLLLLFRFWTSKSFENTSLHSLFAYFFVYGLKVASLVADYNLLPTYARQNTGYLVFEILNGILSFIALILLADNVFKDYSEFFDVLKVYYILPVALVLASIFHSNTSDSFVVNLLWYSGYFLHAMAILPQLVLFTKKGGVVHDFLGHYVACQGLGSIFQFLFWFMEFSEKGQAFRTDTTDWAGQFFVFSQLIQVIIFIDFGYKYFKSMKEGTPLTVDVNIA